MTMPVHWMFFVLQVVVVLFWFKTSEAHYDHSFTGDWTHQHYYSFVALGDKYPTPIAWAQGMADYYNQDVCVPPEVDPTTERWRFKKGATILCPNPQNLGWEYTEERHCAWGQTFNGESCVTATDNCVAGKDDTYGWFSNTNATGGFNVPDDTGLDAPFTSLQNCSFKVISSTARAEGFDIQVQQTGTTRLDEDGLPYAGTDGADYADCIPWQIDEGNGNILDWGQTGNCENSSNVSVDLPDSGGPDNEGSDDTNPAADPNSTASQTNVGNEGVEERLDNVVAELEEHGDKLAAIDSELDEIDSNTERIAAANELREIRELSKTASGGQDCLTPPSCSGDPIQCAQLEQQWHIRCDAESGTLAGGSDCQTPPVCTGDPLACGQIEQSWLLRCEGRESGDEDFTNTGTIDVQTVDVAAKVAEIQSTSGWIVNTSCPQIPPVNIMGTDLTFDFLPLCDLYAIMSYLVMGFSGFFSMRILMGAF